MKVQTVMGLIILLMMAGYCKQQLKQDWEQAHEQAHGWTASGQWEIMIN